MLGVLGSIAGGLISGIGASSAAKSQEKAADAQMDLAREQYKKQTKLFAPYRQAGKNYLDVLNYELLGGPAPMIGGSTPAVERYTISEAGLQPQPRDGDGRSFLTLPAFAGSSGGGEAQYGWRVGDKTFATEAEAREYARANRTGGTEYGGFTKTPGYDFRLSQGIDAIAARAAAGGNFNSGATGQALLEYGQDYASNEYNNYLNRITGRADQGQAAAGQTANASMNYTNIGANALANRGDAQASGAVGMANAFNTGIGNALGAWQYQQGLVGR